MQKFLAFTTLLISLLVVSCEVEHIRPTQAISITSSTSVEVGRYAGEFVVSYTADSTPEKALAPSGYA